MWEVWVRYPELVSLLKCCYGQGKIPHSLSGAQMAKNNHKATRGFWIKENKNTLEAYRDSYARTAGNHPSTKSKMPKKGPAISLYIAHHSLPKGSSDTLVKLQKLSKHFFSLNSNFGIGGSSSKTPPFIVGA
ncbi:hypothetical protein DVH24_042804 [Malus domestica]|uniref:Uncharacterized protein n=1 Tax=Malus domestica TaxID=3750 RepID=A0A498I279_MALDO|nr:hypothetical protein DVH24_042804 [Malus domestica]